LVREISLKLKDIKLDPWHAIQLTSDQFVVSYYNNSDNSDVVEVDTKRRRVDVSYTNQLKSTTQQKFNVPRHLSVDEKNGFILVADMENHRMVILNRSLKCDTRDVMPVMTSTDIITMSVDGGLQRPSCLYFKSSQNRLFVGESKWLSPCRVLVFDNVIQQSLSFQSTFYDVISIISSVN
jgi:hypothetical protein